jgi:hypothetical protein
MTRSLAGITFTSKFRKRLVGMPRRGAQDLAHSPLASAILLKSLLLSTRGFELAFCNFLLRPVLLLLPYAFAAWS